MPSYNRVIIMGNLTRDPEFKQLASGQMVCRFGLASNRQFKNKQTGAMIQEVCFIDVDVWGPQAETCNQYLQKGRGVLVEGRLKFDTWQDNDGQRRNKHSIVADRVTFLSSVSADDSFSVADRKSESGAEETSSNEEMTMEPAKQEIEDMLNTDSKEKGRILKKSKKTKTSKSGSSSQDEDIVDDNANEDAANSGEVDFKDEKPFDDDLPF